VPNAALSIFFDRLRQRFAIRRVCVVADRGMISAATIAGLEERRLEYILGARERSDAIAKAVVLKNKDPFVPLLIECKRGETQLFAKGVTVEGRRYIVCRNEAEAEKDRLDRQAIVASLQDALRRGEKALIGDAAYRRYLRKSSAGRGERVFEIDAGKLAEAAHFASRALSSPGRSPQARCPEGFANIFLSNADNDHKNATADAATGDLRNDRADVEIAGNSQRRGRPEESGLRYL